MNPMRNPMVRTISNLLNLAAKTGANSYGGVMRGWDIASVCMRASRTDPSHNDEFVIFRRDRPRPVRRNSPRFSPEWTFLIHEHEASHPAGRGREPQGCCCARRKA